MYRVHRSLAIAASATLLCGCALSLQSTSRQALAPLAVDLAALTVCRQFLHQVPLPDLKTGPAGDLADDAVAKEDAAIMTANGRIGAADRCVASVQQRYAGGKKG